jgi:hypothetical protein
MRLRYFYMVMAAVALVGCAPKATFDVTIMNQTSGPVTVGLVKDGPPPEADWAAPEDQALETRLEALRPWGHVIPPGRTMDSSPVSGTFPRGAAAYLRVYAGTHSNAELLAISRSSPDRAEVLLFPGHGEIVVRTDGTGRLRAERAGEQRR